MQKKRFARRKSISITILAAVCLLLLTACNSTSSQTKTLGARNVPGGATATFTGAPTIRGTAMLKHSPDGIVELKWQPNTHTLSVTLELIGLAPNSIHPAHIHAGDCKNVGKVVYPLDNIVADEAGTGSSTTKISNVTQGIPINEWSVNVHNGPNLAPDDQFLPIACANIVNPDHNLKSIQIIQATLGETPSPNQSASGSVQLMLANRLLTVTLSLKGLGPKTNHEAHIHAGSCSSQGKILYSLKPIMADAAGNGSSTTVIPDVTNLPVQGWYINVHLSTDMSTQTGSDPIVCGDVHASR